MRGNCLTYSVKMLFAERFTGRIRPRIVTAPGGTRKLRFYYQAASGELTYFFPNKPKRGLKACAHAFWFEGHVRRGTEWR